MVTHSASLNRRRLPSARFDDFAWVESTAVAESLVTYPDLTTEEFEYVKNGQQYAEVKRAKDRAGRWTSYDHDLAGRVVEVHFEDTGDTASFAYDAAGNVTAESFGGSSVSRSHCSGRATCDTVGVHAVCCAGMFVALVVDSDLVRKANCCLETE